MRDRENGESRELIKPTVILRLKEKHVIASSQMIAICLIEKGWLTAEYTSDRVSHHRKEEMAFIF